MVVILEKIRIRRVKATTMINIITREATTIIIIEEEKKIITMMLTKDKGALEVDTKVITTTEAVKTMEEVATDTMIDIKIKERITFTMIE
jgi:hypothetical protein